MKDFSILIKNMSFDEPERYGMLKDVFGNFCNAIEARFKDVQYANIAAINNLIDDFEEAMLTLGLTEGQEELIRSIAQQCLNKTNKIFDESMDLKAKFDVIEQTLTTHHSPLTYNN